MGYDSDDPIAHGEVGKVGVAIDSIDDMRMLFDGIPLDKVSTSMTINAPAAVLLLLYQLVAEEQGVPGTALNGTIQNDILKEYIARGTYIFPPKPSLRLVADTSPTAGPRSRSGTPSRSPATTWPRPGRRPRRRSRSRWPTASSTSAPRSPPGWPWTTSRPRLSFFFVARTTLLEEVAKFRAARRIWARVMRDEFGAKDPKSLMLRFHTQTAGVQLTAQQPEVNLVRVAVQALGAVLGGTQSLHTNSYDEAIALPTEKAARLALRTQQVLAYETDLTATVDPFAGSYVVEAMTDEVEAARRRADGRRSRSTARAVDAIEAGFQKREIETSAYRIAQEIDAGERVVVGVNRFALDEEEPYEPLRVDPAIEAEQAARLARAARRARRGRGRPAPRASCARRPRGHGQRALPDEGGAAGPGHGRRGLRHAARGLGRLRPARRLLTHVRCQVCAALGGSRSDTADAHRRVSEPRAAVGGSRSDGLLEHRRVSEPRADVGSSRSDDCAG